MRVFILLVLAGLLNLEGIDPNKIARINKYKNIATEAYQKGNWAGVVNSYSYLLDTLDHFEDEIVLNLGHAYLKVGDTSLATGTYQRLVASSTSKNTLKSKAYQQLGVINASSGKADIALKLFKESLLADPYNNIARYNYELIKKLLDKENADKSDDELKKPDIPEEPSAYAKELKMQADRLAAQFKYAEAIRLMEEGLKVDPSVIHYKDYVQRLTEIVEIVSGTE